MRGLCVVGVAMPRGVRLRRLRALRKNAFDDFDDGKQGSEWSFHDACLMTETPSPAPREACALWALRCRVAFYGLLFAAMKVSINPSNYCFGFAGMRSSRALIVRGFALGADA